MPTRIKPIHDLGPCILTLESIERITELVEEHFRRAIYTAHDGIWEIFDEPRDLFLKSISQRAKLDSFKVVAQGDVELARDKDEDTLTSITIGPWQTFIEQYWEQYWKEEQLEKIIDQSWEGERYIEIVFNENAAKVVCYAPPKDEHWFEHFLPDLKKHVLRPSFSQRVSGRTEEIPYCRIVLQKKPPDPFIENIKANLVSSLIWLLIGTLVALLAQWILHKFGIDLIPFD